MIASAEDQVDVKVEDTPVLAVDNDATDAENFSEIASDMDGRRQSTEKIPKSLDATQMYLNEIGFSPLLSADEEKPVCIV